MKTIEILVGIPCSGKTTYAKKVENENVGVAKSVSRDALRLYHFGPKYKQNKKDEQTMSNEFHKATIKLLYWDVYQHIILDNTHCKEVYIDMLINRYKDEHIIKVHFFDVPILLAHYRNIIRYFKTGKWISIKIINNMYKNYNKINKKKYAKYMVHK